MLGRFNFKEKKKALKKIPRILAEHAFLTFLGLLLINLIFGGMIFYQYSVLVNKVELKSIESRNQFKEKDYQSLLQIWQEKESKKAEIDSKNYPNLFQTKEESLNLQQSPFSPPSPSPSISPSPSPTPTGLQALLETDNFFDFLKLRFGTIPPLDERADLWEEKGLGRASEYYGSVSQNQKLLEALKKELTQ